jgi:hypothetical protein
MLTPPLQRFNDATIQRFNDPRGSRRVSRALSGVSPKSSVSGLRFQVSPFQRFTFSLAREVLIRYFTGPQKIPLQIPLPAPITHNMKKELTSCLWLPGLVQ